MARIPTAQELGRIVPQRSQVFVPGPRDFVGPALRGAGRAIGQLAQAVSQNQERELKEAEKRQDYQSTSEFYNFETRMRERLKDEYVNVDPGETNFGQRFLDIYDEEFTNFIPNIPERSQPRFKASALKLRGQLFQSATAQQRDINEQFYKDDLAQELNRAGLIISRNRTEHELNNQYTAFVVRVNESGLSQEDKRQAIRSAGPALAASLIDSLSEAGDFEQARRIQEQFETAAIQGEEMSPTPANMLRNFEGFRTEPYWDVNAWRIGYGSDTITLADGTIKKVRVGDVVSREDAERDLRRRIGEFQDTIVGQIGRDAWTVLPDNVQAALTSVAYNYGDLPENVRRAAISGDIEAIASSIEARSGDNDGVNEDRRRREAAIARGDGTVRVFNIGPDWSDKRESVRQAQQSALIAERKSLETDLSNDPMGLFNRQDLTPEIDLTDPQSFQQRAQDFARIEDEYAPEGYVLDKPLSKKEVRSVIDMMETGTTEEQLELLRNLNQLGPYTDMALKQIRQDNGNYGYVADMYSSGEANAQRNAGDVLRGFQFMTANPDQTKLLLKGGVTGQVKTGELFASLTGAALFNMGGPTAQAAKNTADALYLARQLSVGEEDFDEEAYEQAVEDVLGGELYEHNGVKIVLPAGVSEDQFEDFLSGIDEIDLEAISLNGAVPMFANGEAVQASWIEDEARLIQVGRGQFGMTDELGNPVYDETGEPYIMEIDQPTVEGVLERARVGEAAPALIEGAERQRQREELRRAIAEEPPEDRRERVDQRLEIRRRLLEERQRETGRMLRGEGLAERFGGADVTDPDAPEIGEDRRRREIEERAFREGDRAYAETPGTAAQKMKAKRDTILRIMREGTVDE